MELYLSGKDIS
jgi:hypothetical protein